MSTAESVEDTKGMQKRSESSDVVGTPVDDAFGGMRIKTARGTFIPSEEHQEALSEITRLKEQIKALQKEVDSLRGTSVSQNILMLAKNSELDLLRDQNQTLKEEIQTLREEIILLTQQRDDAHAEIISARAARERQDAEIKRQDARLRRLEKQLRLDPLYKKFVDAIQDANAYLKLELTLLSPHKENLGSLHSDRIGSTHYMYTMGNDRDTEEQIQYKLFELQRRLTDAPPSIRNTLFRKYGATVDQVRAELEKLNISEACVELVSNDDIELLSDWWLDELDE
jgi:chromosome segregation ATPase